MRGTPLYLAPELFERGSASVATDVYALGVLLFYLVTGGYPVTGSSIEALRDAHRRGERRRLRDERPDLPDAFVATVERALEHDPQRRFASAGELHAALEGASPKPRPRALTTVLKAAVAIVIALAATGVVGLVATRAFESVLRMDREFSANVVDYFIVGRYALLPFAIVWAGTAAVVAALGALLMLVRPYIRPLLRPLSQLNERLEATAQAGLIVFVAIAAFAAATWYFYPVYNAMTALALDGRPDLLDLSVLGPAGRVIHRNHALQSAVLSFLIGLAAWFWLPRLERRAAEPSRVRILKWAAVILAYLVIVVEAGARPFIWDQREVVLFKNHPAFVIGSTEDELLLFRPAKGERRSERVRMDAPELRRNVAMRALFDALPSDLNAK
jgi:hypothetical protein